MKYSNNIHTELYLSEQTYKEASSIIKSKSIKVFLNKLADSRKSFRKQLSVDNKVGNRLLSIGKYNVGFDTTSLQQILIKCLNEEENLIREYQRALNTNRLDQDHYQIISKQLNGALKDYNQLRALKLSESYS